MQVKPLGLTARQPKSTSRLVLEMLAVPQPVDEERNRRLHGERRNTWALLDAIGHGKRVGQRDADLLHRRRTGFLEMVAADVHRIPFRDVLDVYSMVSAVGRRDGSGGKIYVPRARNSLRISFCIVPRSSRALAP